MSCHVTYSAATEPSAPLCASHMVVLLGARWCLGIWLRHATKPADALPQSSINLASDVCGYKKIGSMYSSIYK